VDNENDIEVESFTPNSEPIGMASPIPRLSRLNQKPRVMEMSDALRQTRATKENLESWLAQPTEAGVVRNLAAGGRRALNTFTDIPENTKQMYIRTMAGHVFPNMTDEQARYFMQANFNAVNAIDQARAAREFREGTSESHISGFIGAAGSMLGIGLVGIMTGGYGAFPLMATMGAGGASRDFASNYAEKHGGLLDSNYTPTKDQAYALAYGVLSGYINSKLGVHNIFRDAVRGSIPGAVRAFGKGAADQFIQNSTDEYVRWGVSTAAGRDDRNFFEATEAALTSAVYGALVGGMFGGAGYAMGRARLQSQLERSGIPKDIAAPIAQNMVDGTMDRILTEVRVRDSLMTHTGGEYNGLVNKIESALNYAGWEQQNPGQNVRNYAELVGMDVSLQALRQANIQQVPITEVLDLSQIRVHNNIIFLETPDMNNAEALNNRIKEKRQEIKNLQRKVGLDNRGRISELRNQIGIIQTRIDAIGFNESVSTEKSNADKANTDQANIAETAPEIIPELQTIRQAALGESFVYVGNQQVPVQYMVLPMADVQASHVAGVANPNYGFKELQNRTRGTLTDNVILQERANNFKAEEMLQSPNSQYGAPIINQNRDVIAGNGRFETLARAYEIGRADTYTRALQDLGFDTTGIDRPVLVRQTIDLTPQQQLAIAEASNVSGTSAFDHARLAMNDAKTLTRGMTDAQSFGNALPINERQAYMLTNGKYDMLALQRRFDDAVMAWVIGDAKTFENLVLANKITQKVVKGITQQGANIVAFDNQYPQVGLRQDLRDALVRSAQVPNKQFYTTMVSQVDFITGDMFTPNALLYTFTFSTRSGQIGDFLNTYMAKHTANIEGQATNQLFKDTTPTYTKADITGQTVTDSELTAGKWKDNGGTDDSALRALFTSQIPQEVQTIGTTLPPVQGESFIQDSQVQNIVYHGTTKTFTEFDKDTQRLGSLGKGFYFTNSEEVGQKRGNIIRAFISLKNPLIVSSQVDLLNQIVNRWPDAGRLKGAVNITEFLQSKGIDGVIWNRRDGTTEYAVYEPNQISINKPKTRPEVVQLLQNDTSGLFDSELKAIVIGSNFNTGTLPHEFAHFWLDKNFQTWKSGKASAEFNADFGQLADILNVTREQNALTRDQHEAYARLTEAYIFGIGLPDGRVPIMNDYLSWLPPQYNTIKDIRYRGVDGKWKYPILNQAALDYFDRAYNMLAGMGEGPTAQQFTNQKNGNGDPIPTDPDTQRQRIDTIDRDAGQQLDLSQIPPDVATQEFDSTVGKLDPLVETEMNAVAALRKANQGLIQRVLPGRKTNTRAQMESEAKAYIAKNRANAEAVAFASPIPAGVDTNLPAGYRPYLDNNTGIDRAVLIRMVMENYTPNSAEYNELYHNFALHRSYAGKSSGLTNDINQQFYMRGYMAITKGMLEKTALARYGKGKDSTNRFVAEIDAFVRGRADAILATAPDTAARTQAVNALIQAAQQQFGVAEGVTAQLFQDNVARAVKLRQDQKTAFIDWAERYINRLTGAEPTHLDLAKLMEVSAKAQQARIDIDSENPTVAAAAGLAIRQWKDFVRGKEVPQRFMNRVIGEYAPRAMLSAPSTQAFNVVTNVWQHQVNQLAMRTLYGKNNVASQIISKEKARLRAIYDASGISVARQAGVADPSFILGERIDMSLRGEQGLTALQIIDPMRFMGKVDFEFRIDSYLDALARMATRDAGGDATKAAELFNEYKKLNPANDTAHQRRTEARLVGDITVFQQDGTLANIIVKMRNYLDYINLTDFGKPGHKGLGTLAVPFAKIPANVVELGLRVAYSPFGTIKRTFTGEKATIQQRIDQIGFGVTAAIVTALIAAGSDYEEPYRKGAYDPLTPYNSINIGGLWFDIDGFGAMAGPIRFALMIRNAIEAEDELDRAVGQGVVGLVHALPFTPGRADLDVLAANPTRAALRQGYTQVNKLVPSIVRQPFAMTMRTMGQEIDPDSAPEAVRGIARSFARQYGLDGEEVQINDFIRLFYSRAKWNPEHSRQ